MKPRLIEVYYRPPYYNPKRFLHYPDVWIGIVQTGKKTTYRIERSLRDDVVEAAYNEGAIIPASIDLGNER